MGDVSMETALDVEAPMTLAQAVAQAQDDLAVTCPTPELDADGNRIGPDTPAEWDGMDDDPPSVMVDLEAAYVLVEHARANPAARFLADEARGLTNIAGAAHRQGDGEKAQWMLTLASAFARKATELDPSLGDALDVVMAGEGDGNTVSERAVTEESF